MPRGLRAAAWATTMVRTTAPTAPPATSSARAAVPPLGRLWQVPTFLLGVVVLTATVLTAPLWQTPRLPEPDQAIRELRAVLSARTVDTEKALALTSAALREAEADPGLASEAHFLVGSAHVAAAERTPGPAAESWARARAHLEQAQARGVGPEDAPRLAYRLGKALAQTEPSSSAQVIPILKENIEAGADGPEDAARGYALLAQAYLRATPPDVEAALAATEQQLQQPIVNDALLAPARLARGELLLRLRRNDEARQVLRHVGNQAPPAIAGQARLLVARSLEADELWADAAQAWREAIDRGGSSVREPHVLFYHLGLCLRNAGRDADAARAWEECLRHGARSDETQAAALALGEIRLKTGAVEEALTAYERALREVEGPQQWRNALVSLERVRESFETAGKLTRESAAFDASCRLAKLYERLALPGRAREMEALALEAWGRAQRQAARGSASPEADRLLVQAGRAVEQAGQAADTTGRAEHLWRAALLYSDGNDPVEAAAALERFLSVAQQEPLRGPERFGPRIGEAWYRLAEARRASRRENEALEAFTECLKWDDNARVGGTGRFAFRARYQLALAWKARGHVDDALSTLEQNLQMLRDVREGRDPEVKEKTLFLLGDLYFERRGLQGELAKAISCLEGALEQFPQSSEALVGRYELAESYRLTADQLSRSLGPLERLTPESRLRINQEVGNHRARALAHYQELGKVLSAKPSRTPSEEGLLSYALFKAAECRFLLGEYENAGREYELLAERYRGRPEHFQALAEMVRAYTALAGSLADAEGDGKARSQAASLKARKALQEIREGVKQLDPETRAVFEKWLEVIDSAGPR